jgi:hypothetical protein
MREPRYPSLYQINTRVWLTAISQSLGRPATVDDIPDAELDRLAELGFDWIWFLSIWQTGPSAQQVSRNNRSCGDALTCVHPTQQPSVNPNQVEMRHHHGPCEFHIGSGRTGILTQQSS